MVRAPAAVLPAQLQVHGQTGGGASVLAAALQRWCAQLASHPAPPVLRRWPRRWMASRAGAVLTWWTPVP